MAFPKPEDWACPLGQTHRLLEKTGYDAVPGNPGGPRIDRRREKVSGTGGKHIRQAWHDLGFMEGTASPRLRGQTVE